VTNFAYLLTYLFQKE